MTSLNRDKNNPFQITTPEDLSADQTNSLFVEFTDFSKITKQGHVFLTGPRGVGKSMMFRYLQADCQCLANNCSFSELKFLGIYIPIKNESFVKTEFVRFDNGHASEIFNEHLMVSHFCVHIFDSLLHNSGALSSINFDSLLNYYKNSFLPLVDSENTEEQAVLESTNGILDRIIEIMNKIYLSATQYSKKLAFINNNFPEYNGLLLDYQDFLIPLISALKKVEGISQGIVYLLIDDAHFLSDVQTRILNSWIATRTSGRISLKVSTQYNYKNYYTVTGATIDTPHDYSEIDMATVYTSNNKTNYRDKIKTIVEKRLRLKNINTNAEEFFQEDVEQEREIEVLAEAYRKRYDDGEGRGHYRSDDAIRYSRPDYIKNLAGPRKASSTYNYAGFKQLVHISSGVVRYFLESAYTMYSTEETLQRSSNISCITPTTQNNVVRDEADNFFFFELDKYKNENNSVLSEDIDKLRNLMQGLGGLFREILLSDRSERRVFSIAISDNISPEVERILKLSINLGFFHRSTIGRKNSMSGGRTKLYVMNKRLAPLWTLDPTGFAGYLFLKNHILEEGLTDSKKIEHYIRNKKKNDNLQYLQGGLFGDLDGKSENDFEIVEMEGDYCE